MVHKYNVDDLKYIYSLKHKRKAVVYYDDKKGKYIDVNSNTVMSNYNERVYNEKDTKVICDFNKIVSYNYLFVLLIDAYGQKRTKLTAEVINEIMSIFDKVFSFTEPVVREIDYISNLVAEICVSNLALSYNKDNKNNEYDLVVNGLEMNISEEEQLNLKRLLSGYVFIDTAVNLVTERKTIVRKEKKLIDYKILRSLKYLGININIEDIPNFKIEYNLEGINYYDSKGNKTVEGNLDKEEVEKVKKFVDKCSI